MKSLVPLYECLLIDSSRWCRASTHRDIQTITERVEDEGLSFLTITLPNFCKSFEQALAREYVVSSDFPGFRKTRSLPSFLKGLMRLIFDQNSGRLLEVPDPNAIFYIRQITLYAKKIQLPCTEKRTRAAFSQYVQCDNETRLNGRLLSQNQLKDFGQISRLLFGDVLAAVDREISDQKIVPRHGPGKTADKVVGNRKYELTRWTRRLEENFFPSADFTIPNYGHSEDLARLEFHDPGHELPVEVVCVPKTLKTPRIIAMEPAHMQYAQQAILEVLVQHLENDKVVGKMIGFTDQGPNRRLAREGSINGLLSTLDLSEASDRVSLRLVSRLLQPYPALLRAVMACRSQNANVPGHGALHLAKFASMGSALCFPMEAMVFLTIIFIALKEFSGPLTFSKVRNLAGGVRVYGDDLIVPTYAAHSTMETLSAYGLKVNPNKSFCSGKFRESCGGEYYAGYTVTPVKLTRVLPNSRHDAEEFIALVAHRNQLYEVGAWKTVQYIDHFLEILSPFPVVRKDSSALGRWSFLKRVSEERWDSKLQRWLVKAATVVVKIPVSRLSGSGALLKFFLKRGENPIFAKDHLERSGRPRSVDTRLRWVSPL